MKGPETLPAFSLKGTDQQIHEVPHRSDRKGTVIIFTCNHCPYARAWVSRIAELVNEFHDQGIDFFAINPNDASQYPQDSFEHMPEMAGQMALDGHYLHDEAQTVAQQFGAERTPEVFLFNQSDQLVYHGVIDDNWQDPAAVRHHYLRDALRELLEGQSISQPSTKPVGCSIKWKK